MQPLLQSLLKTLLQPLSTFFQPQLLLQQQLQLQLELQFQLQLEIPTRGQANARSNMIRCWMAHLTRCAWAWPSPKSSSQEGVDGVV